MHTLTERQADALALIEDNPEGVEAVTRIGTGYVRINGNVENVLTRHGLIEKTETYRTLDTVAYDGGDFERRVYFWKLTEAGRDALRATTLTGV